MNRKDYRKIARQNKVSIGEVKREMQYAINNAFIKPNFFANCIPRKGAVPTVDEFMDYAVNRVKVLRG